MWEPAATLFCLDEYALYLRKFLLDRAVNFSDVGFDLLCADNLALKKILFPREGCFEIFQSHLRRLQIGLRLAKQRPCLIHGCKRVCIVELRKNLTDFDAIALFDAGIANAIALMDPEASERPLGKRREVDRPSDRFSVVVSHLDQAAGDRRRWPTCPPAPNP